MVWAVDADGLGERGVVAGQEDARGCGGGVAGTRGSGAGAGAAALGRRDATPVSGPPEEYRGVSLQISKRALDRLSTCAESPGEVQLY